MQSKFYCFSLIRPLFYVTKNSCVIQARNSSSYQMSLLKANISGENKEHQ